MRMPFRVLVLSSVLVAAGPARPIAGQDTLTLTRAIQLAQQQGYAARAAEATRDASRYRNRSFSARQLPRLSVGGTLPSYNRAIIPVVQPDGSTSFRPQDQVLGSLNATLSQTLPVTGGDFFVSSSLQRLSVSGPLGFRTWSSQPVQIGIRQPILRPNANGWDRREEPVRSELAERQYQESLEEIALQTTNLFFDVYAARVGLDNARNNALVNDTLYTLNKGRFEVGKIGENDLLQSELALLRARNSADGARLDYDRALAALRLAINLPANAPLEIAVTDAVPVFEADTTRAEAEALRNRAIASDAELRDVQASRRITEARLNNGLGATVVASYGFNATGGEARDAYRNLLEARQFTLSVEVPLLQWGLQKSEVRAAVAEREQVRNTTRAALDAAQQEAHFAALQLAQARRTLELSAKADTVARKRYEVAYNRYVIGRIALDNLFVAQSEKDQALGQYVQSLRGYWLAHYQLRRTTLFDFESGRGIR
jgi:outer membrane protein TolC